MCYVHTYFSPWYCLVVFVDFACSSSFWKKMEPIFGPVSLEEASYLKEQVVAKIYNYFSLKKIYSIRLIWSLTNSFYIFMFPFESAHMYGGEG